VKLIKIEIETDEIKLLLCGKLKEHVQLMFPL